jgi:lipoate---protein ligase
VSEDACRADGIPVLARDSGGGTVVLGAGCLNYALAVSLVSRPALVDVTASFRIVLETIASALGVPGLVRCGTDLALDGRKVGGSAQRRGRRALLHHGTLLFAFDAALATRYLREPDRQPAYRQRRCHEAFLTNLPLAETELRTRLECALRELTRGAGRADDQAG